MAQARQTIMYGTPTMLAMMKAAAPIRGGIICPPVEAVASTPPANEGEKPILFINGMVTEPVVTTLATALPDMVPIAALDTTATLADHMLTYYLGSDKWPVDTRLKPLEELLLGKLFQPA